MESLPESEKGFRYSFKKFMEDPENRTPSAEQAKNALRHLPWLRRTSKDPNLCLLRKDAIFDSIVYYRGYVLQARRALDSDHLHEFVCLKPTV